MVINLNHSKVSKVCAEIVPKILFIVKSFFFFLSQDIFHISEKDNSFLLNLLT